ncbi:MAG: hypothetical protein AAGD14_17800, partial [Planctomycetota bacterium]
SVPGGTATPTGKRGGAPTTVVSGGREHNWEIWWTYNREWYLASRLRGTPVSGGAVMRDANGALHRKKLRETVLRDILLEALDDSYHDVRSAAAVALGKFGDPEFNRRLRRRIDVPREKWWTVHEAVVYGMSALALPGNRGLMTTQAGDKQRPIPLRSLALTSLMCDGTKDSLAVLLWHLRYHRSSMRFKASQSPTVSEEDRRRFAAHLLGFVDRKFDVDDTLFSVALGSRRWTEATQGLAITALGRRRARTYKDQLFRIMDRREVPLAVRQSIPIALAGLVRSEETRDVERLARFIRDERRRPAVRHFATMALARIGGERSVEILQDYLRRNVFNVDDDRAFAYLALGLLGGRSKEARDTLMLAYEKPQTPSLRSALAIALGLARHNPAVALTSKYLKKTSIGGSGRPVRQGGASRTGTGTGADVLAYGTLALGLHGDESAVPAVERALTRYRDPKIQGNAAVALVLLQRSGAIRTLKPILEENGNAVTRGSIIMALGLVPQASDELVQVLRRQYKLDRNPASVRAMAVIGLGAIGDPRAVPLSVQLVRHYNYLIRCQALDVIASLL